MKGRKRESVNRGPSEANKRERIENLDLLIDSFAAPSASLLNDGPMILSSHDPPAIFLPAVLIFRQFFSSPGR